MGQVECAGKGGELQNGLLRLLRAGKIQHFGPGSLPIEKAGEDLVAVEVEGEQAWLLELAADGPADGFGWQLVTDFPDELLNEPGIPERPVAVLGAEGVPLDLLPGVGDSWRNPSGIVYS
jgi:hypothetical protein